MEAVGFLPTAAMQLVFVYNARSGMAAALFDSAHKLVSPQTYQCQLCALTYGLARPKREWVRFLKQLSPPPQFLHRDEFLARHPGMLDIQLPAIFGLRDGNAPEILADGAAIQGLPDLEALIALVEGFNIEPQGISKGPPGSDSI